MIQRQQEKGSLDFFPTPPWATRALFEHVIGVRNEDVIWEPACGQGHMAEVLKEYSKNVIATDIHDYGYGEVNVNFLEAEHREVDWIITNPPFNLGVDFTLKALSIAKSGVAILCRTQWIEGKSRYEKLFSVTEPSYFAPFCERVPMVKGRWDPTATTPMSYSWFVWEKWGDEWGPLAGHTTEVKWIPPGQRKALTKENDVSKWNTN